MIEEEVGHDVLDQQTLRKFAQKTNFNLRLSEIVRQTSCIANLVVMTLPVPKKDNLPSSLYMALLDFMTRDMPPFLMVRGNQESVLTFYSWITFCKLLGDFWKCRTLFCFDEECFWPFPATNLAVCYIIGRITHAIIIIFRNGYSKIFNFSVDVLGNFFYFWNVRILNFYLLFSTTLVSSRFVNTM